ncbi:TIGR03862 family flavoprotein [Tropicimonas sp.]|uniref:TIGR03862 family flavoprotein n=1 Tax=Tropicimonas sp. TaxID=2067044 RepID=UPI003A83E256
MERVEALVIGAGPAGLMAAEALSDAGRAVVVAEAMPSIGRKLLMAGKSGLNLTRDQPFGDFLASYAEAAEPLRPMLSAFGPQQVRDWAGGLGQPVFTGSTGRVFPRAMKASPLLRAWAARLGQGGVSLRRRWRWTGWEGAAARFDTPEGPMAMQAGVTVLALGGASWSRLGSDGAWAGILAAEGIPIAPFRPANAGLCIGWSAHMQAQFGQPLKGVRMSAGGLESRGEAVISARGLEGGGIYALSRALREGAPLRLDLLPDWTRDKVAGKLARPRGRQSLANHLRRALRLDPVKTALLMEFGRPLPDDAGALAARIKGLDLVHRGLGPLDEAISTAGGVMWPALDGRLALRIRPDVFVAGEMLDWEAPTGGYLLTGCLATGRWAGRQAAAVPGRSA